MGSVTDQNLLGLAVRLLLSGLGSKVSERFGVPTLVRFLVLGLLVGSDGPGGETMLAAGDTLLGLADEQAFARGKARVLPALVIRKEGCSGGHRNNPLGLARVPYQSPGGRHLISWNRHSGTYGGSLLV